MKISRRSSQGNPSAGRAVATFEATEAAASVVFTTLASVTDNNYFEQLKFKYESHDYIAVTHNR